MEILGSFERHSDVKFICHEFGAWVKTLYIIFSILASPFMDIICDYLAYFSFVDCHAKFNILSHFWALYSLNSRFQEINNFVCTELKYILTSSFEEEESPGAVSYWEKFCVSQILTAIFGHKAGRR